MKKGINASCFPEGMKIEEIFQWAADAGYTGMELMMSEKEDEFFSLDSSDSALRNIKKMAKAHSVELFSVATSLHWKYSLTDKDGSIRDRGIKVAEKMIDAAVIFESDTVLIVPGVVTPTVAYDEAYVRSWKAIQHLTAYAESRDVRIGIENVWNKFLLSPMEMADFADQFNSPNLGVYLDIGNVMNFGYPEQWIRILGNRIFKVHVKDFRNGVGNIHGFVPLLSGDVSWELVMKELSSIGYQDYVTPELNPHPEYPYELISETSRSLDRVLFGRND